MDRTEVVRASAGTEPNLRAKARRGRVARTVATVITHAILIFFALWYLGWMLIAVPARSHDDACPTAGGND